MLIPELTYGDILSATLSALAPIIAFVLGWTLNERTWLRRKAQRLYQPFLLDLKKLREKVKDYFYNIESGASATKPLKRSVNVFSNEEFFIEDEIIDFYEEIKEKLDKYEELGGELHGPGGYLRNKYGERFKNHLFELISSDPNPSLSGRIPAWAPSEKFVLNEKPFDREIEKFNDWKEDYPELEKYDPEEVYTDLREILLEDKKVKQVLIYQEELLEEINNTEKKLKKHYLRGMWGRFLKYLAKIGKLLDP